MGCGVQLYQSLSLLANLINLIHNTFWLQVDVLVDTVAVLWAMTESMVVETETWRDSGRKYPGSARNCWPSRKSRKKSRGNRRLARSQRSCNRHATLVARPPNRETFAWTFYRESREGFSNGGKKHGPWRDFRPATLGLKHGPRSDHLSSTEDFFEADSRISIDLADNQITMLSEDNVVSWRPWPIQQREPNLGSRVFSL